MKLSTEVECDLYHSGLNLGVLSLETWSGPAVYKLRKDLLCILLLAEEIVQHLPPILVCLYTQWHSHAWSFETPNLPGKSQIYPEFSRTGYICDAEYTPKILVRVCFQLWSFQMHTHKWNSYRQTATWDSALYKERDAPSVPSTSDALMMEKRRGKSPFSLTLQQCPCLQGYFSSQVLSGP